jgi:hypothetical protein
MINAGPGDSASGSAPDRLSGVVSGRSSAGGDASKGGLGSFSIASPGCWGSAAGCCSLRNSHSSCSARAGWARMPIALDRRTSADSRSPCSRRISAIRLMAQVQRVGHQGSRRPDGGLHAGAQLGGCKLQHLRGAFAAELPGLLGARQRFGRRQLCVWMVQIRPMRRQLHQGAFLLAHLAVSLEDERQCLRGIGPAERTIEHTFILEAATDTSCQPTRASSCRSWV